MIKDKTVVKARLREISSSIRKLRESKGYTQDYIAGQLRISQNGYSKIELGQNRITLERLLQVAAILEVPETEFFKVE